MQKKENNFAFIDAQNLYLGLRKEGWKMDYKKFRVYLREKYSVARAYMFMGYIPENWKIYEFLRKSGFVLIFKTISDIDGHIKGNCDGELILQAMIDFPHYEKAVIVSGDGDFCCLVRYLNSQKKLLKILAPSKNSCSHLLKKLGNEKVQFLHSFRYTDLNMKSTP